MTGWWQPASVRVRLMLWHLAALVTVLVVYAGGVYVLVRHNVTGDLDRLLREDFDRAEDSFHRNPDGTLAWLGGDIDAAPSDPIITNGPWACVWTPDGRLLYRDRFAPAAIASDEGNGATAQPVFRSVRLPDGKWIRELSGPQDIAGGKAVVTVARSEARVRHELRTLLVVLGAGLPLACVLAGLGAYFVARRALAPIDRMATAAERITAAHLSERLPVENPGDELGHLASVFNTTFARLESSFDQLRRFTADASHEMRTPLTAIRTVGEVGLREPRSAEEYRAIIGSMLEETQRLNRLVESLLTLARADGGTTPLALEPIDLSAMAREVGDHLSVLAEDKGQVVTIEAARPVVVGADRVVLRQAVINIVDNAIKYSPEGGRVTISVTAGDSHAVIAVRDSGAGIPAEHLSRIFDRFYRIDAARSRDGGGTGLGLSIARRAVEAHRGHIEAQRAEGGGMLFQIVLPIR